MVDHAIRSDSLPQPDSGRIERLIQINLNDLYTSFKVKDIPLAHWALDPVFRPAARWFAHLVTDYDDRVGAEGLADGARWIVEQMNASLTAHHAERVPREGPLLVLANHPGVVDTMALAAVLPRHDGVFIAHRRPFLEELPHTSRHIIYVEEDDTRQRMTALRQAVRHLESGGSIMTFPGGSIDPDPAGAPGAITALEGWSPSVAMLARRVPGLRIVPTLLGGVISDAARRSPLVWAYTDPAQREWAAATIQVALPMYRQSDTHVHFGPPISNLVDASRADIMQQVRQAMTALIRRWGEPSLYGD